MPVRKVSNRGRKNTIGSFPSDKMNRMIAFESLIERDCIYILEFEPDVLEFEEQPLSIEYQYENKQHHYTPDFHVKKAHQEVIIECKPSIFVDTPENCRKFDAARQWCEKHNYRFEIVTESKLRAGFRLENIKFLTRFARQHVEPDMQARIYDALLFLKGNITLNDLASQISPENLRLAIPKLLCMAYHHEIVLPLDQARISGDTTVSLYN